MNLDQEVKILNVAVQRLHEALVKLGADKVFDDDRIVTHLDDVQGSFHDQNFKLTEEGKLKLSISTTKEDRPHTVKLFVSRKGECLELLQAIGVYPKSESRSHRISFEWSGIDFDIDKFPQIPAFLEIDLGDSGYTLEDILQKLNLTDNDRVEMTTPEIYQKYNLNYFDIFKVGGTSNG